MLYRILDNIVVRVLLSFVAAVVFVILIMAGASASYGQTPTIGSVLQPCYVKAGVGTTNDTTNHANCYPYPAILQTVRAVNTTATLAYVRLYNLNTDVTCTSSTGFIESIPVPANSTGAGIVTPVNVKYTTGISYCITGAGTATDNSAPPAGVYITLTFADH